MIFSHSDLAKYKLINHRNVNKLIDVEFLHDLYNQVSLEVNPVRFRHVISNYKHGVYKAYAPLDEWNFLRKYVGQKFLMRDYDFLYELEKYIQKPKNNLETFIYSLKKEDLKTYNVFNLVNMLTKVHYLALNEIYGINLIQIEEGIYYAITQFSKQVNISTSQALSLLLGDAHSILIDALKLKASLSKDKQNGKISQKEAAQIYKAKFNSLENAYGDIDESTNILNTTINLPVGENIGLSSKVDLNQLTQSERKVAKIIKKYSSKIFELRDKNKLLMGKVSEVKNDIYNELINKLQINREDAKFYLLSELYKAVTDNYRLDTDLIDDRKQGLTLKRQDEIINSIVSLNIKKENDRTSFFKGLAVSNGTAIGKAHIVNTKKDSTTLKNGEILVAPGTDFNLIDAFYKGEAFLTEEGGILSHASIVARELHKPCIVGIKNITEKIQNNDTLIINGRDGIIGNFKDMNIGILGKFNRPNIFGQKANRLSGLKKKGFPVATGLALSFDAQKYDLNKLNLTLYGSTKSLWNADNLILRSSNNLEDGETISMAGKYLSVVCKNNEKDFNLALRKLEKNNHTQIFIQPYIKSKIGGVAFVQKKGKKTIIEASKYGPEAVVNGKLSKRFMGYLDDLKENTTWPNIVYNQLETLSKEFEFDIDVEWCIDTLGKFWIFQVRPVTRKEVFDGITKR